MPQNKKAILDDEEVVPLEPKPRKVSERVFCIGLKKDNVGWRMIVAKIPESTLNNHVIERHEPDVFDMVLAKVESKLLGLIYD